MYRRYRLGRLFHFHFAAVHFFAFWHHARRAFRDDRDA